MVSHILAPVSVAVTHLAAAASSKKKTATSSSGGVEELIFIGLIVLAAWLLFFRPRSRQAQKQRQLLSTLVVGDEVVTGAGIYGTVLDVYPDRITIETAPGTRMTVVRSTVSRKVDANAGAPTGDGYDSSAEAGAAQASSNGYAGGAAAEDTAYDEDDEDAEADDDVYDEDDEVYDDEGYEDEDDDEDDEDDDEHQEGGTDVQSAGGEGRGR